MTPYYTSKDVTLHLGDALDILRSMPDEAVDCVVTSPPYYGLRDYGVDGQYGLEATPSAYVETMRAVFAEARRVLARDGTLWLNLGDSYYSGKGEPTQPDLKNPARRPGKRVLDGPSFGLPRKNLLGIPWRVAFALQDDGWILRNAIVWHKPNAMPEAVRDRLSKRYESIFLFAKQPQYWFDLDAIRQPHASASLLRARGRRLMADRTQGDLRKPNSLRPEQSCHPRGANPGDVWSINNRSYPEAHFATFPIDVPIRCVKAGCKPGGVALDPFSGSGATGEAALRLGRRYVGIDLSPAYHDLAIKRYAQCALDSEMDAHG